MLRPRLEVRAIRTHAPSVRFHHRRFIRADFAMGPRWIVGNFAGHTPAGKLPASRISRAARWVVERWQIDDGVLIIGWVKDGLRWEASAFATSPITTLAAGDCFDVHGLAPSNPSATSRTSSAPIGPLSSICFNRSAMASASVLPRPIGCGRTEAEAIADLLK